MRSRAFASRSAKSSAPAAAFSCLIAFGRAGQLLLQAGGEIGVGVLLELLQVGEQRVARGQHFAAQRGLAELVAAALARPREAAVADEIDQPRFPAVDDRSWPNDSSRRI